MIASLFADSNSRPATIALNNHMPDDASHPRSWGFFHKDIQRVCTKRSRG
jgi:hypothetical protein